MVQPVGIRYPIWWSAVAAIVFAVTAEASAQNTRKPLNPDPTLSEIRNSRGFDTARRWQTCVQVREAAFRESTKDAALIVHARATNDEVVKVGNDEFLKFEVLHSLRVKKGVQAPAYVLVWLHPDFPIANRTGEWVIRSEEDKGHWVASRAWDLKSPEASKYFVGLAKLANYDDIGTLRIAFRFLDASDERVADDARAMFEDARWSQLKTLANGLTRADLAAMLRLAQVGSRTARLYALLLGLRSTEEDVPLLKGMLERTRGKRGVGMDSLFIAWTLINQVDGWNAIRSTLRDHSAGVTVRFEAWNAVRFFGDVLPDRIGAKAIFDANAILLDDPKIAPLVIDKMRVWHDWSQAEAVLRLFSQPSSDSWAHTAVLRFAMCMPRDAKVDEFLREARAKDPKAVSYAEDGLADKK